MKLYFSPGACSMASHMVIQELGLKCEIVKVDLSTKKFSGGNFLSINPRGQVPTLQLDNGEILTEGAVIMQYLADQAPEKNLIPKAGTFERYRCQEWLNYIATEVHKNFSPLWDKNLPEETKTVFKTNLTRRFEFLNEKIKGKTFLMGTTFTVADCYLYTVLSWVHYLKIDLTPWTNLMGYMEKIKHRPATMATFKAEQ
ncbi:MAG: glutathione transferase GstA [Bdellovibrionales bacterium]|nr:glutathione transferase GstA [Bdellovibrionales bacterium]